MTEKEALRLAIAERGTNQTKLAKAAGIKTPQSISQLFDGKRGIRTDILVQLLNAMNYTVIVKDNESGEEWQLDMKPEQK